MVFCGNMPKFKHCPNSDCLVVQPINQEFCGVCGKRLRSAFQARRNKIIEIVFSKIGLLILIGFLSVFVATFLGHQLSNYFISQTKPQKTESIEKLDEIAAELKTIKNDIGDIELKINNIESSVTELNDKFKNTNDFLDSMQNDIKRIKSDVEDIHLKIGY